MANVSIKDLDKSAILAALYNAAVPMGMGYLHYQPNDMTIEQAKAIINKGDDKTRMFGLPASLTFDYVMGRPLKIDITGDELDTSLYDRDQGDGKGEQVINQLRNNK